MMDLIDNKFIAIKNISHLKNHEVSIDEYSIKNNTLTGQIDVKLWYVDNNEEEKTMETKLPMQIFLDDDHVLLELGEVTINVVDNQGIEVLYQLIIENDLANLIIEDVDEKLTEVLKERDERFFENETVEETLEEEPFPKALEPTEIVLEPVKIIDEPLIDDFLPQFQDNYQCYKVVYTQNDEDLLALSQKYSFDNLICEKNKAIIIKIDE